MRLLKILGLLLLAAGSVFSQSQSRSTTKLPANSADQALPASIPNFDVNAIDKTAEPCNDFYQYACGNWMAHNPIPSDQSRWGRFNELSERNRSVLHNILEQSASAPQRSPLEAKYGDYYAACMDEKAVEAAGAKPLQPELARIAGIKNKAGLITEIAHLHSIGVNSVFNFYSGQDLHNATQMIAYVDQGGLSLPDRDYYLKEDAKSKEARAKYQGHMQKMFELLGDTSDAAAAEAQTVLATETSLAQASMDRTLRRDPKSRDHKMTRKELLVLAPAFEFNRYFRAAGSPAFDQLDVANPEFFKQVNAQLDSTSLANWKTYLRWHLLDSSAPYLSSPFVNENFAFTGEYLTGQKENQARWKRCVRYTDRDLGEAVGQEYVQKTFGAEGKKRASAMVQRLEASLQRDIQEVPWMSDETKPRALAKLHAIANKIGYPDKWRDYSALKISRSDFLGDTERAGAFESHRVIARIGKPLDRSEWGMTPPTVNAYYNGGRNEIVFPAGILQPPFYDNSMDDAVNYGGIGVVIGHELTHGFDDQGRKFDPQGNFTDWWTETDGKEFEKRASCVADEYSNFVSVKDNQDAKNDIHLNGQLTLGENTADNGGLRIAYMALEDALAGKPAAAIDGYTPEQRFFLGFGQIWCENRTEQISRVSALTDPHSPGRYRVIGAVSNSPEFAKAFSCKKSDAMVRENACRVW